MATTFKFKKGDLVIIDESGRLAEYEIVSPLNAGKKGAASAEPIYEAKSVATGFRSTVSEDQILRLATPVDNSAELFSVSSSDSSQAAKRQSPK